MKKTLLTACIIFTAFNCFAAVRETAVAGQFYPANPAELSAAVDSYLKNVPSDVKIDGEPVAFLVPHAGYVYSAQIAAYSFKLLAGRSIDTVIIIGNSHNFYLDRGAVWADGEFRTPLGSVKIDSELAKLIISKTKLLAENNAPHIPEHSLEVQLPFFQRTLSNFRIVPILLSQTTLSDCEQMGAAIAAAVKESGRKAVIVASSDMSHYPSYQNANLNDSATLKALSAFDPAKLKAANDSRRVSSIKNLACSLCGEEAVYAAMYAAKALGADSAKVLNYSNSGDTTGDQTRVVGYGAAVFYKSKKGVKAPMVEFKVSDKNQKELLAIARKSIEGYLKTGKQPDFSVTDKELLAPGAVFVTLTEFKRLRGCIGTTTAQLPLYQAVSQLAVAAAVEDTRFPPVEQKELKDIRIEISVLSPLAKIKDAGEIKPNIHGVVVKKGFRSGLFLPQVWEQLPTKEEFMSELCYQKAGLDPAAWKNDPSVELFVFTVFAFEEEK
jgi:MEMO1 family protein